MTHHPRRSAAQSRPARTPRPAPPGATASLKTAPPAPPGTAGSPLPLPQGPLARELSPEDEAALAEAMQAAPGQMAAQAHAAQMKQAHDQMARMLEDDPVTFLQKLPEIYGQAIAGMVTQGVLQAFQNAGVLPVKPVGRLCATCLGNRLTWNQRHATELEHAQAQAMAQVGATDPNDPRLQQVDIVPLLPPGLRPGAGADAIPTIFDAATTVNGTEVCPQHHPANPQQAAGGKLILMPGVSVHAAAHLAMTGAGGMPGAAVG